MRRIEWTKTRHKTPGSPSRPPPNQPGHAAHAERDHPRRPDNPMGQPPALTAASTHATGPLIHRAHLPTTRTGAASARPVLHCRQTGDDPVAADALPAATSRSWRPEPISGPGRARTQPRPALRRRSPTYAEFPGTSPFGSYASDAVGPSTPHAAASFITRLGEIRRYSSKSPSSRAG
jgi:hypothetical protein